MKFWIFLFLFSFDLCICEIPKFTCTPDKPLRTKDNACTNFNDICVKKNDEDCNNFQSACTQCPASNYSVLMFMDILNVKNQINITNMRLNSLESQLENNKKETIHINKRQNEIFILLLVVIVVMAICIVLLICEVRFKLITKFCTKRFENESNYQCLNSRKYEYVKESVESASCNFEKSIQKSIDSLDKKIDEKTIEILDKMEMVFNLDPLKNKTKFKVEGYKEMFYLDIDENDTVVKVKRDLCNKLSSTVNFKTMKIKFKDKVLDNNNKLITEIGTANVTLNCFFDNNIKPNEIIAVNVSSKSMNPILLQFYKNQSIDDLKNLLSRFNLTGELIILKGTTKLNDKSSMNDLELVDDGWLTVIPIETKLLKVASVFDDDTIVKIEYSTKDRVKTLIYKITHKNSSDPSLYVLFIKNKCLDEEKYVYEYDIENELSVQYCCLKRLNGVEVGDRLYKGKFSELLSATEKHNIKEMLLLKYDVISEKEMKENKHILKELEVFQIAKFHERFVKLLDIYHNNQYVYVAIENMSKGTVNMYLKKNFPLETIIIHRWLIQILNGLQYLHNNDLILRDLNPNHILIDKDENVKLYSFNLSKDKDYHNPCSIKVGEDTSGIQERYFAPEIHLGQPCDKGTDVWSLGAVLIKIATGKSPYGDLDKKAMIYKICTSYYIEYELPKSSTSLFLKDFIDSCLKPLVNRATVEQLQNHDFISKNEKFEYLTV